MTYSKRYVYYIPMYNSGLITKNIITTNGGVIIMSNITTKELSALEDHLNSEKLMIKKYQSMAQLTSDPQIRTKCEQIAARHNEHYTRLMAHLG